MALPARRARVEALIPPPDGATPAGAKAREVGVEQVRANLLPEDKVAMVVFADMGASLVVAANGLRLLRCGRRNPHHRSTGCDRDGYV